MALQQEFKSQGDFLFKHRSYLPLIFLTIGLMVFAHHEYYEIDHTKTWLSNNFEVICLLVSLLGFGIRVITIGHTAANTSGRNTKEGQIADELNTTGIYSIVRHPLYLGNFFMWLGVSMLTENFWFVIAFIFFYFIYYERIMYAEESFLIEKFGSTYLVWAERTPAFIPSIKHYKPPIVSFNLRKVLRKEKNGFAAIFILFWVFDIIGELMEQKRMEFNFWFYAAIVAGMIYLVLKILKKRKVLEDKQN